jgi:hypothetical protein
MVSPFIDFYHRGKAPFLRSDLRFPGVNAWATEKQAPGQGKTSRR